LPRKPPSARNLFPGSQANGFPGAVVIDGARTARALSEFKSLAIDGYDLFLLQAARACGVTQIISDDGDFCIVPGVTLFTSNQTVIAAAGAQGKLVVR